MLFLSRKQTRALTQTSRLGLGLLLFANAGCSVTALAERDSPIAVNQCESNDDCPGARCVDSVCIASTGSLAALLFEVFPTTIPSDNYPGEQMFALARNLPPGGGHFDLSLGDVAEVTGHVRPALGPECPATFVNPRTQAANVPLAADGSVPARVMFVPTERAWGLSTSSRTVLSSVSADRPNSYPLRVSLPAGHFDIYVEPYGVGPITTSAAGDPNVARSCALPPQLLRDQEFTGKKIDLNIVLPTPTHLGVRVEFPESAGTLDGWTLDMLEPLTNRVVSTRVPLALPTSTRGLFAYTAGLYYFPVPGDEDRGTSGELLRLAPPEGLVAPTLFFQRTALELFSKGSARINQVTELPKAVTLEARVIDGSSNAPVPANVTFIATKLGKIPDGTLASFIRSAEADEAGELNVALLPGTYKVQVVPTGTSSSGVRLAAAEAVWQVAAEPPSQLGRTFALYPATAIRGRALVRPSDEGARGAIVTAEASSRELETSVLARALDALPLVPRTLQSTVQDASGDFVLYADPGRFDLSVRPPDGSSFPWLVMPELDIDPMATEINLGDLWIEAPVRLDVSVVLGERPSSEALLDGAHLRAYALLDAKGELTSDPDAARAAVPVAETRLDKWGQAAVLLPAKLNGASAR